MARYRVRLIAERYLEVEACDPDDAHVKAQEVATAEHMHLWDVSSVTRLSNPSSEQQ